MNKSKLAVKGRYAELAQMQYVYSFR